MTIIHLRSLTRVAHIIIVPNGMPGTERFYGIGTAEQSAAWKDTGENPASPGRVLRVGGIGKKDQDQVLHGQSQHQIEPDIPA